MGWHTGTANDYRDLLAKIAAAAVADGWTQLKYVTNEDPLLSLGFTNNTDELILKGPGFGQGFEVYVGIRSVENALSSTYCLRFNGLINYDPSRDFDTQQGMSPPVHLNVWNTPIPYWLSISDRRILVIAKCSNTYHSAYAGFILPFSSPTEYPYPMYVASDSSAALPFGNTDFNTRGANCPGDGGGWFRDGGGLWRTVCVFSLLQISPFQVYDPSRYSIYPYGGTTAGDNPGVDASLPLTARFEPIAGYPGSMPMMPCYMQSLADRGGFSGALEGVFWIPGNTFSAEQEITNGPDTYRVFIQISRSFESPSPYFAVKEA